VRKPRSVAVIVISMIDHNVLELLDPVCGIAESKAGFYDNPPAK
jgi:hypothetical protein